MLSALRVGDSDRAGSARRNGPESRAEFASCPRREAFAVPVAVYSLAVFDLVCAIPAARRRCEAHAFAVLYLNQQYKIASAASPAQVPPAIARQGSEGLDSESFSGMSTRVSCADGSGGAILAREGPHCFSGLHSLKGVFEVFPRAHRHQHTNSSMNVLPSSLGQIPQNAVPVCFSEATAWPEQLQLAVLLHRIGT